MVKRLTLSVLLLLVLLLAAGTSWLLRSPQGTRWLLKTAASFGGAHLSIENVDGSLTDDLLIEGVRLRHGETEIDLERLKLEWHPARLLRGDLIVSEFSVRGADIILPPSLPPEEKHRQERELTWPRLSGWLLRFDAVAEGLELEQIAFHLPGGEVRRLDSLNARLAWDEGILSVGDLSATGEGYRLRGDVAAGFASPLLHLDLELALPEEMAGVNVLRLSSHLEEEKGALLAGLLKLRGDTGSEPLVDLEAEIALEEDRLRLRRLELTRADLGGALRGTGEVDLGEPFAFSANVRAEGIDLAERTGLEARLAGTLEVSGTVEAYAGDFELASQGETWRGGRLSGQFSGTLEELKLHDLEGDWLRGSVGGEAIIGWRKGLRITATLSGRSLDPVVFDPLWTGEINLDVQGTLETPPGEELRASAKGQLLDSSLRGRPLTGRADLSLRGEDLRIAALELHGDDFALSAQGRLHERLQLVADVRRLAGLVPGAAGRLQADGWLRWREAALSGELGFQGEGLSWAGAEAATLNGQARRDERGDLSIEVRAGGLAYAPLRLNRLQFRLRGSVERHDLQLQAGGPRGSGTLRARGGWKGGLWSGTLQQLMGETRKLSAWQLSEPAPLALGARKVEVASLRLEGEGSMGLELTADLEGSPFQGTLRGAWRRIDLSLLNPWMPGEIGLAGSSSGNADLRLEGGRPTKIAGTAEARGRLDAGDFTVDFSRIEGMITWNSKGLDARLRTELQEGGGLSAELKSGAPPPGIPESGTIAARWEKIDLSLLNPWMPGEIDLAGSSSGNADLRLEGGRPTEIAGTAEARGRLDAGDYAADFSRIEGMIAWNSKGLDARLRTELQEGGELSAELKSGAPPPGTPERGTIAARWENIDLERLRPWLPAGIRLDGALSGESRGEWLPGGRLALSGDTSVDGGEAVWRRDGGEVAFDLRAATADWQWEGESLKGQVALELAEVGRIEGTFHLPLPARIPTAPVPEGAFSLELAGEMREKGLLSALLPGLLRESQGKLTARLAIDGTWRDPSLEGRLYLSGAGAYLPTAGIELEEVEAEAVLEKQRVRVVSFSARSGPGRIEGEGEVQLDRWRPVGYRATLTGERFRAVDLPELQLLVSPDLRFRGTDQALTVRGKLELPELILIERKRPEMVAESSDVVIVGEEAPTEESPLPVALDLKVQVILGQRVLVKYAGVDARLAGELTLVAEKMEDFTARGEIRVAEGIYSTYGVQLKIVRGRVLYAGGPIDRPTLDILALRTIGDVKAGVQVSGTPRQPVVDLYSEPVMPDTDVLSYVVLGHPAGGDRQNAGLLMAAAGTLLSRGESAVLQDRLKRQLGVDVLAIESGGGEVESSMVTIGKYLSPRLYISYGRSLFSAASEARLRYDLGEDWELESKMGEESGVDLFYKIEFE